MGESSTVLQTFMTPTSDTPLSPALTSTPNDITAATGLTTPGSCYGLITHNKHYIQTLRSKARHVVKVHVIVMSSSYQILPIISSPRRTSIEKTYPHITII